MVTVAIQVALKKILVVDDHFEMLEFLRNMLELASAEYQVLGVPSAEEGMLELGQTAFDLIITDLRLPGMSGFDLARKVKATRPELPIIMITGYDSEEGQKEASDLGLSGYFKKPVDTDSIITTVNRLLDKAVPVAEEETWEAPQHLSPNALRRLEALRSDTGARMVMLLDTNGRLLAESGSRPKLDLRSLATTVARAMEGSMALGNQLRSPRPLAFQYQTGQAYDLYSANVGESLLIAIFFDAADRRGRIGTIWVFAQRAIKDLLEIMEDEASTASPARMAESTIAPPTPATDEPLVSSVPDEMEPKQDDEGAASVPVPGWEAFELADQSAGAQTLSQAEAQEILGVELPDELNEEDLEAFWDLAIDLEGDNGESLSGMSFDDAREQGLIPDEFESNQES